MVTGVILMFYYRPTGELAYHDMKYLQFDIPFGMIMRNMHRWSAHAMVIAVWIHMMRVFMTGSYKPAKRIQLGDRREPARLHPALVVHGYLLPWDQLAIWAVTVGTNMARATPLLGHEGPFADFVGVNSRYDARSFLVAGRLVARRRCCGSTCCTASSSPSSLRADDRPLLAYPERRRHLGPAVSVSETRHG